MTEQDIGHDRYMLHCLDSAKEKCDTNLLTYLQIRDNEIWTLTDLLRYAVSKSQIVLGFYAPLCGEAANSPSPDSPAKESPT